MCYMCQQEVSMKFCGLMGVSNNGMLVTPSGVNLFRVPVSWARVVQRVQHWYAARTWK